MENTTLSMKYLKKKMISHRPFDDKAIESRHRFDLFDVIRVLGCDHATLKLFRKVSSMTPCVI